MILILSVLILCFIAGCTDKNSNNTQTNTQTESAVTKNSTPENTEDEEKNEMLLKIEVNDYILYADLENNSSAEALKEKLSEGSITIEMSDYGNFEKVGDLPFELPRNDRRITTEPGDVILYQGNKLTVYYDVNTWEFTKIAKIRDTDKSIKEILGSGNVSITLSLQK